MICSVNEITQIQSRPTEGKKENADMLFDYASTYPNEVIHFHESGMVLHVDLYTAHIIFTNACSCTYRPFFLSNWPPTGPSEKKPKQNGLILTEFKAIKKVVYLES